MIASAYPSLAEFFASVYHPRRLLGSSPLTVEQYAVTLRHFARFLSKTPMVTDLDEDRISEFLLWFSEGRKSYTVWSVRKHLMALANYAHKKGLICEVPDVAPVRRECRAPRGYHAEDIMQLLAAARDVAGKISGVEAGPFWFAFFLVAYNTGERWSALWGLEWADFQPPFLLFQAKHSKTRKERLRKITEQCTKALQAIRLPERQLIFDHPFKQRARYNHVRKIFKAAGLPHGRHDLLQRVRQASGSLVEAAGGDGARHLGNSRQVFEQHYRAEAICPQSQVHLLPPIELPETDQQKRLF